MISLNPRKLGGMWEPPQISEGVSHTRDTLDKLGHLKFEVSYCSRHLISSGNHHLANEGQWKLTTTYTLSWSIFLFMATLGFTDVSSGCVSFQDMFTHNCCFQSIMFLALKLILRCQTVSLSCPISSLSPLSPTQLPGTAPHSQTLRPVTKSSPPLPFLPATWKISPST